MNQEDNSDGVYNDAELEEIMEELDQLQDEENDHEGQRPESHAASLDLESEFAIKNKGISKGSPKEGAIISKEEKAPVANEKNVQKLQVSKEHSVDSHSVTERAKRSAIGSTSVGQDKIAMEFAVVGNMEVALTFHLGQQDIFLSLKKSEGLVIELKDGMKCVVPIK